MSNVELTGRLSVITDAELLVIAENLPVERLVPEAQSAKEAKRLAGHPATPHSRGAERRGNDAADETRA